jgi:hypothetical protein
MVATSIQELVGQQAGPLKGYVAYLTVGSPVDASVVQALSSLIDNENTNSALFSADPGIKHDNLTIVPLPEDSQVLDVIEQEPSEAPDLLVKLNPLAQQFLAQCSSIAGGNFVPAEDTLVLVYRKSEEASLNAQIVALLNAAHELPVKGFKLAVIAGPEVTLYDVNFPTDQPVEPTNP